MIKYSVTFSTNHNGVEKTENEVKSLTIWLLKWARIDGATLVKNMTGIWKGQTEDSYTLIILSDEDIEETVQALARDIKMSLKQQAVILEQTQTNIEFL